MNNNAVHKSSPSLDGLDHFYLYKLAVNLRRRFSRALFPETGSGILGNAEN